ALVRYGNGAQLVVEGNAAHLPRRIRVESHGSDLFDSGLYGYDEARNVKSIGEDLYRYDGAQRLDWARVTVAEWGTVALDYAFLVQRVAAQGLGGQSASLLVGEAEPLSTELFPEDAVLLAQVIDRRLLLTLDPAGKGEEQRWPGCKLLNIRGFYEVDEFADTSAAWSRTAAAG
nr:hypothetical protein [Acidobacteriota bacterium]